MKNLSNYISEAKTSSGPLIDQLKDIAKNFNFKECKLVVGDNGDGSHLYLKDIKSSSRFYNDIDSNVMYRIWVPDLLKELAAVAGDIIVLIKTWDAIDYSSRISNLNTHNISMILPKDGMLFNDSKEAKQWIKQNPLSKGGGKKAKITPMTASEALALWNEYSRDYQSSATHQISVFKL